MIALDTGLLAMRVLLVEDEPNAAHVLAKGLREHAYAVDVAADGDTAIFQAGTTDYDAVILDCMLPIKDGFAVCRSIRASGCAVPILMVTARDAVDARIEGLDCGADEQIPGAWRVHARSQTFDTTEVVIVVANSGEEGVGHTEGSKRCQEWRQDPETMKALTPGGREELAHLEVAIPFSARRERVWQEQTRDGPRRQVDDQW